MIFEALALREWGRRPLQTLLVVAAIALGVATLGATELTRAFSDRAIRASVLGASPGAALQVLDDGAGIPRSLADRLASVPGVARANPVLEGDVTLRARDRSGDRTIHLVGVDATQPFPGSDRLRAYAPGPFGPPQPFDLAMTAAPGAVVSESLARAVELRLGSPAEVFSAARTTGVTVAGILPDATLGMDPDTAIVDVTTADAALRAGGRLTRVDLTLDRRANVRDVERAVGRRLVAGERVVEPASRIAELGRLAAQFASDLGVVATSLVALGALVTIAALRAAVDRRRPQIATLRALGATRTQIFAVFVVEGGALGSLGALVGMLAGDATARLAGGGAAPPETGAEHAADLAILVTAGAIAVAVATIAAVVPAVAAAAISPVRAWSATPRRSGRGLSPAFACGGVALVTASVFVAGASGGVATIAMLAGIGLAIPLALGALGHAPPAAAMRLGPPASLALANARAAGERSGFASATVMVAVAACLGTATVSASFSASVARWIALSTPGDLVVRPATAASPRLPAAMTRRLAHLRGVVAADASRRITVAFRGEELPVDAFDARTLAARGLRLAPGEVAVARSTARRFGLAAGDVVDLGGRAPLRVRAVVDDVSTLAGAFTVDRATGASLAGDGRSDAIALDVRPGASLEGIRALAIASAAPDAVTVTTAARVRADETEAGAAPLRLGSALGWAALAVALASTIVTGAAAVAERRRELALLRTIGLARRGLIAMIAWEASIVAAIGAGAGSVAGLALGALVVLVVDPATSAGTMRYVVPLPTVATAIAVVLAASLASAPLVGRLTARSLAPLGSADA